MALHAPSAGGGCNVHGTDWPCFKRYHDMSVKDGYADRAGGAKDFCIPASVAPLHKANQKTGIGRGKAGNGMKRAD